MNFPSGEYVGHRSAAGNEGGGVISRRLKVSRSTDQISGLLVLKSELNAIFFASGDHAGFAPRSVCGTTRRAVAFGAMEKDQINTRHV